MLMEEVLIPLARMIPTNCSMIMRPTHKMARHSGYHLAVLLISTATLCFTATLCTPEELAQKHFRKLVKANNDLALNLHRSLTAGSSENVFFSPLSLWTVFGMLYCGTKGQTAKELRSVLGYNTAHLPDELAHQTFQKFLTGSLLSQDPNSYILKTANSILLDKRLDLVPTYKEVVQNLYQTSIQDVDFEKDGFQVVQDVNAWVKDKTNGKIEKLLEKLDPSAVLVLLNAIYFKGTWKMQFNSSETKPELFYNNGLEGEANPAYKMTGHSVYLLAVLLISSATLCFTATLCTPEELDQEHFRKLAKANNDLALNLHRSLTAGSSENVFFSPLSLSTAFGMLYYGTKGQTAKELRNVLGYDTADLPDELVHQTFKKFLTESLPSQDPDSYILKSANSILLDKHLDLVPTYKEEVQDLYQASIQDVDFAKDRFQVVQDVNAWVKDKTNGKIEKLLEDLDPSTILVLLNAVYFKGTWKTQFETSKTRPESFYNNGLEDGAKKVPMMKMTERFAYTAIDDAQVVELPYKGENISMVVLLPNSRSGLESLEKDLTLEKLAAIRQQLHKTKVHLTLPKFKIEYSKEMSEDFMNLGAKDVFHPGADFSGLATDKNLFVSQVIHKAVVEVNEEGSEAAAITGIISNRMRPIFEFTPEFVADHPFLFAIVDKRSDMILFLGRVTNL